MRQITNECNFVIFLSAFASSCIVAAVQLLFNKLEKTTMFAAPSTLTASFILEDYCCLNQ